MDRRAQARSICRFKVLYKADEEDTRSSDTWVMAEIADISRNGIALVTRRLYLPGTIISVVVLAPGWDRRHLLARVIYVREEPNSNWRAGCKLAEPLDDKELHVLLHGLE